MGMETHDARWKKEGKRIVLYLDQGPRDRTRYRVIRCVNSVAWAMGRKLSQADVRTIIESGVEVIVSLKKEGK